VLPVASGLIVALGRRSGARRGDRERVRDESRREPEHAPRRRPPPTATAKAAPSGPGEDLRRQYDAQPEHDRVVVLSEAPID
jgi:hypothetical protein